MGIVMEKQKDVLMRKAVKTVSIFFCDRHYSLLNFSPPQMYNSEALPLTYDQYVVIELADKL